MKGYLILKSETYFRATRSGLKDPCPEVVRALLKKDWETVASPLEGFPPGGEVMTVYTSSEKNGFGRCGSAVYLWAVSGRKK